MMSLSDDLESRNPHAPFTSARSVSVKALLATPGLDAQLAKRIEEADHDQSGGLSLQEIINVFQSEQSAERERRMLRKWVHCPCDTSYESACFFHNWCDTTSCTGHRQLTCQLPVLRTLQSMRILSMPVLTSYLLYIGLSSPLRYSSCCCVRLSPA